MRFAGRRAVVTGGLSGIGEAVAKRIEAEGGKVVVWDMAGGIKTDISNYDSVMAAAEETVKQLGGIDVLVNSAGIAGPTATVTDSSLKTGTAPSPST
jgi:2-dehydro-3-deoxy-L-rhamnonate dehydrogenase (NAD+)